MPGRWRDKLLRRYSLFRRKSNIFIILLIAFIIIDAAFAWYIINYSIGDKEIDESVLDFEIVQLERSFNNQIVVRSEEAVHLILDTPVALQFSGTPTDMALGDDSNAIAVLTDDENVHYFPPGQTTEQFFIQIEDAAVLIGVSELYFPIGHQPEEIIVITSNASADAVRVISIDTQETVWDYEFDSRIIDFATSDNIGYFSVSLESNEIIHFARFSSTPRIILQFPAQVDELSVSGSGINLVALYDNGSKISRFSITSQEPIFTVDLPQGSRNLQTRIQTEYSYVRAGNEILEVEGGAVRSRLLNEDLVTYTVPTVTDKIYVSLPGEIQGYKGTRAIPNWKSGTSFDVENLQTDVGGDFIIGWSGENLVLVDDTDMPLGNQTMWIALGFLVIFQVAFLIAFVWWEEFRKMRRETLYVVVVGAIVGILVAYVFPDHEAINWFGLGVYVTLAGILAAVSTLITWRTEAGLANIVVGLVIGIILAIPLALVAHFIMEAGGHQFPDSPFFSLAKLIYTGLKMGLVGGLVGWIAQRIIKG